MSTENQHTKAPISTGRRFSSINDLLKHQDADPAVLEKVEAARKETRLVHRLSLMRQAAGMTQEAMAQAIGVTQSAISKIESGTDESLTIGQLSAYSKATNERLGIMFGKPLNHVESIKAHASAMRSHLERLAEMANKYDEFQKDIAAFFGEAFFNILNILSECHEQLPKRKDSDEDSHFKLCAETPPPTRMPTRKRTPALV